MQPEIAWLIEYQINGVSHWWTGEGWTIDPALPVRFARARDAEKVIQCVLGPGWCDAYAAEHMWLMCHRPECDLPEDHKGECSPRLGTR